MIERISGTNKKSRRVNAYTLTAMAFGCALLMLCSYLTISIPPMAPVTLQTFAVFLITLWLGWREGFLTVLCYIACGALGLPDTGLVWRLQRGFFSCSTSSAGSR